MVPVLIAAGAALFAGGVAVGKSLGNEGKEEGQKDTSETTTRPVSEMYVRAQLAKGKMNI